MRWNLPCGCACGVLLLLAAPARGQTGSSVDLCTAEINARVDELDGIIAELRGGAPPARIVPRLSRLRAGLMALRRPPCPTRPPPEPIAMPEGEAAAVDWYASAEEHRGQTGSFSYQCPPLSDGEGYGTAWGTDVYTDDSAICVAAVHAGVITMPQGGRVRVEMAPGRESYVGTVRNGIVSAAYPAWEGSFVVHGG